MKVTRDEAGQFSERHNVPAADPDGAQPAAGDQAPCGAHADPERRGCLWHADSDPRDGLPVSGGVCRTCCFQVQKLAPRRHTMQDYGMTKTSRKQLSPAVRAELKRIKAAHSGLLDRPDAVAQMRRLAAIRCRFEEVTALIEGAGGANAENLDLVAESRQLHRAAASIEKELKGWWVVPMGPGGHLKFPHPWPGQNPPRDSGEMPG